MLVRKVVAVGMVSLLAVLMARADVILPNTHIVARCATIGNLFEFPDFVIVGAYENMSSEIIGRYVVQTDSCLRRGYKFAPFYLLWVDRSYFEAQGLENLPIADLVKKTPAKKLSTTQAVSPMGLIPIQGDFFSGAVSDSNPVIKESLVYKLTMNCNGGVGIWLAEMVATDKNGAENRTFFAQAVGIGSKAAPTSVGSMKLNPRFFPGRLVLSPEFSGTLSGELLDCRGRIAGSFTRTVSRGATYVVPFSGAATGIYWLRVKIGKTTACMQLNMFE